MAYDLEETDPMQFTDKDFANGAYIPQRDAHGNVSVRNHKKRRLKGYGNKRAGCAANGLDDLTRDMFRADMAALWRDGETYHKIAESVNEKYQLEGQETYTANDIHYHIKKMLSYWRDMAASRIDERQAMLLARLDQIEQLAIEGYFASLKGKRTSVINNQIERARSKDRENQLLGKEKERRYKLSNDWGLSKKQTILGPNDVSGQADLLVTHLEKRSNLTRKESNRSGDVKFLTLMFNINKERAKLLGLYNKESAHDPDRDAAKLTTEQRQQRLTAIVQAAKQRREETLSVLADPAPLGGFQVPDTPEVQEDPIPEIDNDIEEEDGWDFDEEDGLEWD